MKLAGGIITFIELIIAGSTGVILASLGTNNFVVVAGTLLAIGAILGIFWILALPESIFDD